MNDFVLVYPKELNKRITVYQGYINYINGFKVDKEINILLVKMGIYIILIKQK